MRLVGTQPVGAIESWIPLLLFVILFGLSMDYHVFVVSRIREAHNAGLSTTHAMSHGIRSTAGVVTSAALIMVAVFAVFGTLSMQDFKQLGVGLAVAVLLDATLIRVLLLPSVMALLGDRTGTSPAGWPGCRGSRTARRAYPPRSACPARNPARPGLRTQARGANRAELIAASPRHGRQGRSRKLARPP